MAGINILNTNTSSCEAKIDGLSYNSEDYDSFSITINNITKSVYPIVGQNYTTLASFSNLSPGTTYSSYATAWYTGHQYTFSGDAVKTKPEAPSNIDVSVDGLNITVTFNKGAGAEITLYVFSNMDAIGYVEGDIINVTATKYNEDYAVILQSKAANDKVSDTVSKNFSTGFNRPNDFSWSNPKVQGEDFNLAAIEWNGFTSRINEFREYKDFTTVIFPFVFSGDTFTAAMFNDARDAIYEMNPSSGYPFIKGSGDVVKADDLNTLVNKLNLIS